MRLVQNGTHVGSNCSEMTGKSQWFSFFQKTVVFFTLVIYLIIVIIYNFRILFTVVVCLLILLCYLSKSLFMSSLHGTPVYRATKYFNKGWIKTNTGFFSESSLSWPAGTYGIPKPQSGCPKTDHFHWLEGWRSQGSNSRNLNNSCSVEFHLDGKVDNTMVNRSFCIKDDIVYDSARPAWPKGLFSYFFRTWASCPGGRYSTNIWELWSRWGF